MWTYDYKRLGGSATSGPAIVAEAAGILHLFFRGSDNTLRHRWRTPGSPSWSQEEDLGGSLASEPAAASWSSGRLDVFARGTDNALKHLWYQAGVGKGWQSWESLGGTLASAPAAASWGSGRLDVFARGTDNALKHLWYQAGVGKGWQSWESLGGTLASAPAAASWGSGRLDVFAKARDNALRHLMYQAGKGAGWQSWLDLGGDWTSPPAAASWGPDRIDVVVRGSDNAIYHRVWRHLSRDQVDGFFLPDKERSTLTNAKPPVSGFDTTSTLGAYADAVLQTMKDQQIPAGVLAVMRGDKILVSHGFGWADKAFSAPLQPDAVLRHASLDKYPGVGAVRTLIDSKTVDPKTGRPITDETLVFPFLVAHGLTPLPGKTKGSNVDKIMIDHLINHRAQLNATVVDGEFVGRDLPPATPAGEAQFYEDLKIDPGTSTPIDNIRWIYSQPARVLSDSEKLDNYSSIGMSILRFVVQIVTGDYLTYVREVVLGPTGGAGDFFFAHERLDDRVHREPWYATLQEPHDRWIYLENYLSTASTAESYVRYLRHYHFRWGTRLFDPVTGQWVGGGTNKNNTWALAGGMEGTSTWARQRLYDQTSFAVFFNIVGIDFTELDAQLNAITDTLPV